MCVCVCYWMGMVERQLGRLALSAIVISLFVYATPAAAGDGSASFGCWEWFDNGPPEAGEFGFLTDTGDGSFASNETYFHHDGESCTAHATPWTGCTAAVDLYKKEGPNWVMYAFADDPPCINGLAYASVYGIDDPDGNGSLHVSQVVVSGVTHTSYPIWQQVGT